MHIERGDPNYFLDRVGLDEIDRLVCSSRIPPSNLSMARNNDPLERAKYCTGDSVDHRKMLAMHRQGATIILRSIEQWSPKFAAFRTDAESLLGYESQINVYLTPPQEKSTPPHWDTHDLFVLQLVGEKLWRLFESDRTLPLETERFRIEEDFVGGVTDEILLKPGDTLFLPRGVIHEPVAESYSIHISLGIRSVRWLDVCLAALRLAAREEGSPLRESVDVFRSDGANEISDQLRTVAANQPAASETLAEARRDQVQRRWVDRSGALTQMVCNDLPDQRTIFKLCADQTYWMRSSDESIEINSGVERIVIPKKMESALAHVMAGNEFQVASLPNLGDEERIALCVGLSEIGLLHRLPSGNLREN